MRRSARGLARLWLILVLCGLAAFAAGCDSSKPPAPTVQVAPDSQQVLRSALVLGAGAKDLKGLDPALPSDPATVGVISMVFPGLVALNARQQLVPWAADSLPDVSSDGKSYTFHIRTGLQWSDGTPITAETFAYSINRALSPCTASPANYYLFGIKDAQAFFSGGQCASDGVLVNGRLKTLIGDSLIVQDPQTLKIVLDQPAAYFLETLCFPVSYAVPNQLVQKYGKNWTSHLADGQGFGGNMYKVTNWPHDGTLRLERNDKFWGVHPKLREVDYKVFDTAANEYKAYQAGQVDVGYAPASLYTASKALSGFHEIGVLDLYYLGLNWSQAPFNDPLGRQAFALAIDKKTITDQVLHGTAAPTNHIVPEGMPGYSAALKGPDGTTDLTGNVTAAKQAAQSYAAKNCSGKLSKCPRVVLTVPKNRQDLSNVAQAMVAVWKQALPGWQISVTTVDLNMMFDQLAARQTQFWLLDWFADYPDPQDWLSLQFLSGSANNSGSVNLDQANTLLQRADAEQDSTQRIKDYNAAEQLLVTAVAWIPLYQAKVWWEVPSYVSGFSIGVMAQTPPDVWQQVVILKH
jgi:peptide/nickel transport system substrate-binding protein/oligopeptide transport system substrate-binding protein